MDESAYPQELDACLIAGDALARAMGCAPRSLSGMGKHRNLRWNPADERGHKRAFRSR